MTDVPACPPGDCVMSNEEPALPSSKSPCPDGAGDSNGSLLSEFHPTKVLSSDTRSKSAAIVGEIRGAAALVLLEKTAFSDQQLCSSEAYFSRECAAPAKLNFTNDAYAHVECFPLPHHNGVKATIVYPATEKHIAKYSRQERHVVVETAELYRTVTLPHIEGEQFNLQWVFNILEGKSEQDRVVYNNPCERDGFVLLPDLKWDGVTQETLYLLGIVRRRGIKSLRDLDVSHLPLLKRIRDEGKKAILDKYRVPGSQLRIYFHYQPTFYHLHVHFTYLRHEAPGIFVEKSHLLDTVINNIEMMGNYYQKASLSYAVREMDSLFNEFEVKGLVRRMETKDTSDIQNSGEK